MLRRELAGEPTWHNSDPPSQQGVEAPEALLDEADVGHIEASSLCSCFDLVCVARTEGRQAREEPMGIV